LREKNLGPLRQGQPLDTTKIKCSKIFRLLKVRQKGSTPSAKEHN
jgi:hypothetical protein